MATPPVPDQAAIGTVRKLICYGCGKEARGGHPGTQMDAAQAEIRVQGCAALCPTAVGPIAIGLCIQRIVSAPMKVVAEHSGFIIDAVTSLRPAELPVAGFD